MRRAVERAETIGCRRRFLLGYFGQRLREPCGNRDICAAGTADERPDGDREFPMNSSVDHADWGRGIVMNTDEDRSTALFDQVGYKPSPGRSSGSTTCCAQARRAAEA